MTATRDVRPHRQAGASASARRSGCCRSSATSTIFLLVPTITVVVGAFQDDEGGFSPGEHPGARPTSTALHALRHSVVLSRRRPRSSAPSSAPCWPTWSSPRRPTSLLRRVVTAVCGVLAQFGGVTLAFAFIATLGFGGLLTEAARATRFGIDIYRHRAGSTSCPGLILVYTYFQIPLMVIVFLPALEGLRPQWREAAVSLGATTWQYWTQVAVPLLRPAFLGSMLLLFANAFAAYATAAALVSQGAPIMPLLIRAALTSEVVLGQAELRLRPGPRDGRRRRDRDVALRAAAPAHVEVAVVTGRCSAIAWRVLRWLLLVAFARFFLLPLLALLDFSTQDPVTRRADRARPGGRSSRTRRMTERDHHLAAAGPAHRGRHARAAGADDDLGAAAGARARRG